MTFTAEKDAKCTGYRRRDLPLVESLWCSGKVHGLLSPLFYHTWAANVGYAIE